MSKAKNKIGVPLMSPSSPTVRVRIAIPTIITALFCFDNVAQTSKNHVTIPWISMQRLALANKARQKQTKQN